MMEQNKSTQKQKQLLMKAILMMSWNQSAMRSCQTYKNLLKGSDWIIDSVVNHALDISKYNPLAGSSHKLPKQFRTPPKKVWLIFKMLTIMNALNGASPDIYIS